MSAGFDLRFRVVHDGDERVVTAGPTSIVAFERKWAMGFIAAMRDPRVEWMAWMAHDALHKQAVAGNAPAVGLFDDWLSGVSEIEIVGEEDTNRPLAGTP
mgnify:CR=1 FL=1